MSQDFAVAEALGQLWNPDEGERPPLPEEW
jgi:hypothetical protein